MWKIVFTTSQVDVMYESIILTLLHNKTENFQTAEQYITVVYRDFR